MWHRCVVVFFCLVLLILTVLGVFAWKFINTAYITAQSVDIGAGLTVPEAEVIYDRDGEEMGRAFEQNRTSVELSEISPLLRSTLLAIEDKRFYTHNGIDIKGLMRAILANVRAGRFVQGGSTLTQQLAKHVLDDTSKSIGRKLVELFVAFRLENLYTKNQILTLYLNRVAFGNGFYGIDAASRGYFNTSAINLSASQVAMLVSIIRSPSRFSPYKNPERLRPVVITVLNKMLEANLITVEEKEDISRVPLVVLPRFRKTIGVKTYPVARAVLLAEKVLLPDAKKIKIYTTINSKIQHQLEKIASTSKQVAIAVADIQSGELLGYVGGSNFLAYPYDRFFSMERSTGQISALLGAAGLIESGANPATLIPVSPGAVTQITLQAALTMNIRSALAPNLTSASPAYVLNSLLPLCSGFNPLKLVRSVITSDNTMLYPTTGKLPRTFSEAASKDVLDMLGPAAMFTGSSVGGFDGWAVWFGKTQAVLVWLGTDGAESLGSKQYIEAAVTGVLTNVVSSLNLESRALRMRTPQYVNRSTGLLSENLAGSIPVYTDALLDSVAGGNPWQDIALPNLPKLSETIDLAWNGVASAIFTVPTPRPSIETIDGETIVSSPLLFKPYLFFPRSDAFENSEAMMSKIAEMHMGHATQAELFARKPFPTITTTKSEFTRDMPTYARSYAYPMEYLTLTGAAGIEQHPSTSEPVADEPLYPLYAGRYGLEKLIDIWGLCTPGKLIIRSDYFGYPQAASFLPGSVSPPLKLTISHAAQMAAVAAMSTVKDGAFVVMNANTGALLAMVSKPLGDELNKAVSFHAPPASSFKPLTALASFVALGGIKEYELGSLDVSGVKFDFPKESGKAGLVQAMAHSFNSYFIQLGLETEKPTLLAVAASAGLGSPSGFLLGGSTGNLPDDAFVRKTHSRLFGAGDISNISIGQGDLTVTPLQMAKVYAIFATRGAIPKPRLLVSEPINIHYFGFDLESKYWALLDTSLESVVLEGTGTAARVSDFPSLRAKTGTAQIGEGVNRRNSAWFCGYFLMDDATYSFAILVNGVPGETLSGGADAAPVIGRFLASMTDNAGKQLYDYPLPDEEFVVPLATDAVSSSVLTVDFAEESMRNQFITPN